MKYFNRLLSARVAVLLASLLLPTASTFAVEYNAVARDNSSVQFSYQQMGVSMTGKFTEFKGSLRFDPDDPEAGQASFEVDLSSVDTGTADGNEEVVGKDWFNVAAHPVATFVSETINVTGDGQYDVLGTLTIKGTDQKLTIPATFQQENGLGVFETEFVIQRGDFAVGEGAWSAFDIVANDVTIQVQIASTAN